MRQAARVTRTLTYPRRGLHGEVVHLIGLQIMSGELKPGDPLPPEDELTSNLAVSRTVLREAVRVLAAEGTRGRAAQGRDACAASRRMEHPRPRRPQLARRGVQRQQAVRGDDRGAACDRAPRRAPCRDEGDGGRDRRDRRGVHRDGGRRRRPGGIPRRRPALPRPDSRRVATTSSSATSGSSFAPCFERRSSSRRRRSGPVAGRFPCTRRSSTASWRGTRMGAETAARHAHRRHRGGHPRYRPPGDGRSSAHLELERLEACGNDDMQPRGRRVDDATGRHRVPGEAVPVVGNEPRRPNVQRELDCLGGIHVPDDASRLALPRRAR